MAEPTDPKKKQDTAAKDDKAGAKTSAAKTSDDKSSAKTDNSTSKSGSSSSSGTRKSSSVPETGSGKGSSSSAAAAADSSGGGGGRALLWLVVIIALTGGAAYATKAVWMPMADPYLAKIPGFGGAEQQASGEPSPVQMLSERVAALESKLSSSSASESAMAALKAEKDRVQAEMNKALGRIDDLERRLKEVRELAQAVTSSSGGDIDLGPVMSRIDELEDSGRRTEEQLASLASQVKTEIQASSAGNGNASGLVLAIAQLRDTALSGQPFAAQLNAFRLLADDNPDFVAAASGLAGNADAGLPTAEELADKFSNIAGDIIALARSTDGDWLEQTAARMSSLVSIRRTDGQSGDPVEDAVAEIESRLAARDVPGAVQIAAGLSDILGGEARTVLEDWLLDAKARAGAERALDAIHTSALAGLGG